MKYDINAAKRDFSRMATQCLLRNEGNRMTADLISGLLASLDESLRVALENHSRPDAAPSPEDNGNG